MSPFRCTKRKSQNPKLQRKNFIFFAFSNFVSKIFPMSRIVPKRQKVCKTAENWRIATRFFWKKSERLHSTEKKLKKGGPFGLHSTFASINQNFRIVSRCQKTQKGALWDQLWSSFLPKIKKNREDFCRHQEVLGKKFHNAGQKAVKPSELPGNDKNFYFYGKREAFADIKKLWGKVSQCRKKTVKADLSGNNRNFEIYDATLWNHERLLVRKVERPREIL